MRAIRIVPWFGRFDTGFFSGKFNPNTLVPPPREELIAKHVTKADHVLPTHWDNFEKPFDAGPKDLSDVFGESDSLPAFVNEVRRVSPRTRVVAFQDFFQSFAAWGVGVGLSGRDSDSGVDPGQK